MAYTSIDDPAKYFNTVLYTGNGSTQSITGVGFQPDWVWIKARNQTFNHRLLDSVRGTTKELYSDDTYAEATDSNGLTAFGTDGFSLGTGGGYNGNSNTYVSWNWLGANGTASNSNGSITSSVSASTTSGFSIVSWDGSDANGTIGHGLGSAPRVIFIKNRESAEQWYVYHESMGNGNRLVLNDNSAQSSAADWWQDTSPTSSVFYVSGVDGINGANEMIAYCFAEKKGYSKFGSYKGNGNADGTFIYTGFRPAWILTKRTDSPGNWHLYDNKRLGYNVDNNPLKPNNSETTDTANFIDIVSNGFKSRSTDAAMNASGGTYIYMAFAEAPFTNSNGIPNNAR